MKGYGQWLARAFVPGEHDWLRAILNCQRNEPAGTRDAKRRCDIQEIGVFFVSMASVKGACDHVINHHPPRNGERGNILYLEEGLPVFPVAD